MCCSFCRALAQVGSSLPASFNLVEYVNDHDQYADDHGECDQDHDEHVT